MNGTGVGEHVQSARECRVEQIRPVLMVDRLKDRVRPSIALKAVVLHFGGKTHGAARFSPGNGRVRRPNRSSQHLANLAPPRFFGSSTMWIETPIDHGCRGWMP